VSKRTSNFRASKRKRMCLYNMKTTAPVGESDYSTSKKV